MGTKKTIYIRLGASLRELPSNSLTSAISVARFVHEN